MTQEQKDNKLVTEFMELSGRFSKPYHSSWNWLMPACKKFDNLNLMDVEYERLCDEIDNAVSCYEIKPAFKNLVSAIKWYNQNK